ncbi:SAM-dependent methyltransferase [Frankia sp. AgB32]|uniref:SAM-dependent methyltransferase n=1 Tax=Frankia sp. AgB32 TaxID=631119 RepID=UPI00200BAACC|nr:SAM-dependent methyltransferase [Frankia sp. AgB32]MCK9897904.1 SAM-dependent methyltransferase [Frankia sp. AgB32]
MTDAPTFDTSIPHSARVWNYWLGGKDNYPADRAAGDQVFEIFPAIVEVARASRQFLGRAVTYLAGEAGIRQFLDVGTGLPTAENTHEVAQRVAPESRIVYVDNDPMVLAHARALLTSSPEGVTAYLDADVHNPEKILAAAAAFLDLTQPVALMLLGVLGHLDDFDEARSLVNRLLAGLPTGSYLVLNDGTSSPRRDEAMDRYSDSGGDSYNSRTPDQIAAFFDGLDLLDPGVVSTPLWRPEPGSDLTPLDVHCGIGRKS